MTEGNEPRGNHGWTRTDTDVLQKVTKGAKREVFRIQDSIINADSFTGANRGKGEGTTDGHGCFTEGNEGREEGSVQDSVISADSFRGANRGNGEETTDEHGCFTERNGGPS
jgi:hypothetical protein